MSALEQQEARRRLEAETLAAEQREHDERAQQAQRQQQARDSRDREVRRLAYECQQRLAEARAEAQNAHTDFEALTSELGFGRVEEQAVLDARQQRELARARLEVWERAAATISGDPAVVGRR